MASRSSALFDSEFYNSTFRGRSAAGDIGWEEFPEKTESTDIFEDPEAIHDDRRLGLLDVGPVQTGLLAHEEPRRNVMSRSHLNLHDGGVFGSTTDPYANEDFDTNFHDHDPRGWSDQQPWGEYRRLAEANLRRIDFKDDGDYSTTGGGVHPNTLYKNIRGAQNWTKNRLKIFDTSFEGRHAGGVGIYPHMSNVFKSEYEDPAVDDDGLAMIFEDPVNRQRVTMKLSNMVHSGSPFLRTNDTTDHKIQVAGYAQIYKQRGMMNHESQLRQVEEDTQRLGMSRAGAEGTAVAPKFKRVATLMATSLEERGGINPKTAAAAARIAIQGAAEREAVLAPGMSGTEQMQGNREQYVAKDIMALLGFTANEVKFLESEAQQNKSSAKRAIADLYRMSEVIHKLPAHTKFELRNELLIKAAGGGLRPGNSAAVSKMKRSSVIINPRILQHMDLTVRKARPLALTGKKSKKGAAALGHKVPRHEPLFVTNARASTATMTAGGYIGNKNAGGQRSARHGHGGPNDQVIASYRHVAFLGTNRPEAETTQFYGAEASPYVAKTAKITDTDITEHFRAAVLDQEFGENKALTRHMGRMGTKDMRRYIDSDRLSLDFANEIDTPAIKNSRDAP